MFTRVERETRGRLPDGTFFELAKFVEQSKFGNKNTHYSEYRTSKEKPCPGYGTDNATSILAIKAFEKTTNFNMYWGCWGATDMDDIKLFFQSIETILDLENLVYIDAKNQEELFE